VLRGGCYHAPPNVRCVVRDCGNPIIMAGNAGFRVASD